MSDRLETPDRAIVFIDGNNWYHGLKTVGVGDLGRLDYASISRKLAGPRLWIATRYYVGRVPQTGNAQLYAAQRHFLAQLQRSDARISVHLGRLEPRSADDATARELRAYLANLPQRIDPNVFRDLMRLARSHRPATVMVEKAVDAMLCGAD